MKLVRPDPIPHPPLNLVGPQDRPAAVARRLLAGEVLTVVDRYSTGAEILDKLRSLCAPAADDYSSRKTAEKDFRKAALGLLVGISDHQMKLAGARPIGFLKELYPELSSFYLPFIVCQELHGAWVKYQGGVKLAVLGHRVHPYFGTYVPTRTTHLELFGTWLHGYTGPKDRAIDVGTGSGVLAWMLARAGFAKVIATDANPNAVYSVQRQLERQPAAIHPVCGDLLTPCQPGANLIVFNPPWVQGEADDLIQSALFFQPGLFQRFFDQSLDVLADDGRLVLVFSNLIGLVQPDVPHPIRRELERGRYRLVDKQQRRVKPERTMAGKARRTKEKVEVWCLAKA